jgi:PAS domain S-box-containing protein
MMALVVLTAAIAGFLNYRQVAAVAIPRALERIDKHAGLLAAELEASMRGPWADVNTQGQAVQGLVRAHLAGGRDPVASTAAAEWHQRLASRFAAELAARPTYVRYCLIGAADGGRELVCVDRKGSGGAVRVVPEPELQRRGGTIDVETVTRLAPGEIYASSIRLSRRGGVIETPYVPILEVAAPVFAPDGKPFGFLAITINMNAVFNHIRTTRTLAGAGYVVSKEGDYLVHPDPAREFAFEFGKPIRVQDDFPSFDTGRSMFEAEPREILDRNGQRFGIAVAPARLSDRLSIGVIEAVPYAEIIAVAAPVRNSTLLAALLASLVGAALAVLLARLLTRPLMQMAGALKGFGSGDESRMVPIGARGEVGVMARAFAKMRGDVRDTTEALTESRARLAGVVDSAMDAIISIDERHHVVLFNAAAERIFQRKAQDVLGRELGQLLPGRYRAAHGSHIHGFAQTGVTTRAMGKLGTLSALRADGTEFPIEASISQSTIGSERLFTVILRDITARKRAEEALSKTQRMDALGQLTGGIAHDFNNLLTVIIGNLELSGTAATPDQARELTREAHEAAEMGARLTSRLLTFSRQRKLEPAVINLNEQVANLMDLLRRSIGEMITVSTSLAPGLALVRVDPSEIENAVLNLGINARDAMKKGGKLIIETENIRVGANDEGSGHGLPPGGYVRLSVSDTGSGMPPEVVARAFEPFFTTKPSGQGTGLGLASVYGFAKQSGGNATIYSEPGRGTTVNLYLPQVASVEDANQQHPKNEIALANGETVLVVEDNPEVRRLTLRRLKILGYRTLEADTGPAALAILETGEKIDLIFSDVVMPGGLTGYELAQRANEHYPDTKILLTSGYDAEVASAHNPTSMTIKVLRKPYNQADMARALRDALAA